MKADRLISIIMLLQTRGKLTARQLAEMLEVSPRTIYRDIEDLSSAGIPVYTEIGPLGGCCILDNYRTDLTGLTTGEAGALALLSAPGPLDGLEIGQQLKSALLKLGAALKERGSDQAAAILLDWGRVTTSCSPGILETLYQAVGFHNTIEIHHRLQNRLSLKRRGQPLGLVAARGEWHLGIYFQQKIEWLPVAVLEKVEILPETFVPPPGFNLAERWQAACAEMEGLRTGFVVRIRADRPAFDRLARLSEGAILQSGLADQNGVKEVEVGFPSFESARRELLSYGRGIEILAPRALRLSVLDFAAQTLAAHQKL